MKTILTIEEITEKLKNMLKPKRFLHCLAVKDSCLQLAQIYGANKQKAGLAGLLHDCAKSLTDEQLLEQSERFGILVDDIQRAETSILHAPIGAELARKDFGIEDEEILSAIRSHTTGCENMGLLAKILYVADCIAEDRLFSGVDNLRRVACKNLNAAVIMGMDIAIKFVIERNKLIHPDTIRARNYMILKHSDLDYRKL